MKDIFGLAIYSFFKGNKKDRLILRNEDGTRVVRDLRRYFSSFKSFPSYQKKALSHAKGRVLDIGCGAGKHALYLQNKGMDVTGIDVSKYCIKVCKAIGLQKAKVVNIWHRDVSIGKFDTLILFGHNLAIGGSISGIRKLLDYFKKITTKGGTILLDGADPSKYYKSKGLKMRWEYKKEEGDWFNPYFVLKKDLVKIVRGTGWKISKIFKDKKSSEYSAVLIKNYG